MKQLIQSFKTGETILEELPCPMVTKGSLLIKTSCSLVSLGTERMLISFGQANILEKARQQPEKVKMVLEKIKSDGLLPTIESVFRRLEEPLPLGYCNVGKVIQIGEGVNGFKVGDRVASNGAHAEVVNVPQNLVAKIPDNVTEEEASFTVLASIGLQGIRLLQPELGETIVVYGLGLIGLLTAQLLKANGCEVIGIDIDSHKCSIAEDLGIKAINPNNGDEIVKTVLEQTQGIGVDGVLITASAKGSELIGHAAKMCRKRGRIILIGVAGLNLSRADFYEKELKFQVSCSYGPGRYDDQYEQKGIDYPLPFVRWTAQRNFQAVLQAISAGKLQVSPLVTEKVPLSAFRSIYDKINESNAIASLLTYPESYDEQPVLNLKSQKFSHSKAVVGIIGAGNFSKMTLLPALKKTEVGLKYISSAKGLSGTILAKKYGINRSTTDYKAILTDPEVDVVLIATRHDIHASLAIEALKADKHVFVEKPLAIDPIQFSNFISKYQALTNPKSLVVGFNRRFSPHVKAVKQAIAPLQSPVNIVATMNAGYIPADVWLHDPQVGGGRIVGEACHYLDLFVHLGGSEIAEVCMSALGNDPSANTDNASILVKLANGSQGVINYFSNGSKSYSKERIEVFVQERTYVIDNFRSSQGFGAKGFRSLKTKMDKGHLLQFKAYFERIKSGGEPIVPFSEILNVTYASFACLTSLKENRWVKV
jgi:predicted dehydrogenase/threonine dehydrogenase-like Zn-dependent dehydrogenase